MFTPVTLLDSEGAEYVAQSAAEVNSLMYGRGYMPKVKQTVEEVSIAASSESGVPLKPARSTKSD